MAPSRGQDGQKYSKCMKKSTRTSLCCYSSNALTWNAGKVKGPLWLDCKTPELFGCFYENIPKMELEWYFLSSRNLSNFVSFSQLGIVGRTGSGKSSLFQVLFRMVHNYQGAVLLDGVSLASVPLDILRFVSTGLCWLVFHTISSPLRSKILNTIDHVWPHFQTPRRDLKIRHVFLTNSEVFGNAVKHCFEC